MKQIHTSVPVETSVPIQGVKKVATTIGVDSTVPVQTMKHFTTEIPIQSTVPVAQGIKTGTTNIPVHADVHTHGHIEKVAATNVATVGVTNVSQNLNQREIITETKTTHLHEHRDKPLEVDINIKKEGSVHTHGHGSHLHGDKKIVEVSSVPMTSTNFNANNLNNFNQNTNFNKQTIVETNTVNRNLTAQPIINQTATIPQSNIVGTTPVAITQTTVSEFHGDPNCKKCHGSGFRISKRHHNQKPCKHCNKSYSKHGHGYHH
jgi:hypothetical protein